MRTTAPPTSTSAGPSAMAAGVATRARTRVGSTRTSTGTRRAERGAQLTDRTGSPGSLVPGDPSISPTRHPLETLVRISQDRTHQLRSCQGGFMRFIRTVSLVFAALGLVMAASGQPADAVTIDWPQFRFDNNHTGFNPFETVLNRTNVPT